MYLTDTSFHFYRSLIQCRPRPLTVLTTSPHFDATNARPPAMLYCYTPTDTYVVDTNTHAVSRSSQTTTGLAFRGDWRLSRCALSVIFVPPQFHRAIQHAKPQHCMVRLPSTAQIVFAHGALGHREAPAMSCLLLPATHAAQWLVCLASLSYSALRSATTRPRRRSRVHGGSAERVVAESALHCTTRSTSIMRLLLGFFW
jgi:hypothetical protein